MSSFTRLRLLARTQITRSSSTQAALLRNRRPFSQSSSAAAYKDDQDRESLKPRAQEISKSGDDNEAAHTDAAFNPSITSPEEGKQTAKTNGNSLEFSPANREFSGSTTEAQEEVTSGSGKRTGDKKKSSGGSKSS